MIKYMTDQAELLVLRKIVEEHGVENFLQSSLELETLTHAINMTTTAAQHEAAYTGAYRIVNEKILEQKLQASHFDIVDLTSVTESVGATKPLPRVSKSLDEFTDAGKEAVERAREEGEKRHNGQKRGKRELAAAFLDVRTKDVLRNFLSAEQMKEGYDFLKEMYIHHGVNADEYKDRVVARKIKKVEVAAAATQVTWKHNKC